MKGKLRYDRVIIVLIGFIIIIVALFIFFDRKHEHEYTGDIQTYNAQYQTSDKIYQFELKSFCVDDIQYVSLNDIFNAVKILDEKTRVFINRNASTMTYQMSDKSYVFDYGHDSIVYNNKCIEFKNNKEHIYVSHKNIYISVFQTEKLLLNNQKKLIFKNKNAIISEK